MNSTLEWIPWILEPLSKSVSQQWRLFCVPRHRDQMSTSSTSCLNY